MASALHVLYAGDNTDDAELTRVHFEQHAPDILLDIVHRADALLPLARTRRHAALLVDQQLPDMDGLEVLRTLAREGIDLPIVLVTAAGDGELASLALRLGAADYVPKRPGYLDALPGHLREVIARRRHAAMPFQTRARPRHVLFVEDQLETSAACIEHLSASAPHLTVETTPSVALALDRLDRDADFDLVLSAHRPPAISGLALLEAVRARHHRLPVILIGDSGNEETVVAAFKLGASDYVFGHEGHHIELALRIDLAIERHELTLANERAATELAERRRTVAALRESEKRLNLALEAGRIGLWTWQVGTGHTQFSSRWKAQLGYADHEVRNDSAEWESRCHPEDLQRLQGMTARYLSTPWPDFTVEYRMRHKDGSWRWFMLHADLELDADNRPTRMIGSQIDITALKQQQTELASTSARLQQLSRRLLQIQELERRHLARELHDEIGQVLTVAKIHLQTAALSPESASLAAQIEEPVALLDRLLAQVRSLSLDLRPPLLDDLGLVPSLHWLLQQHEARAGTPEVHLDTDALLGRCDPMIETACFRIAQEALTNALRHARAQNVHVSLALQDEHLRLAVRDDGIGFDAAAARVRAERGGSLGLLGMHERASLAGGTLTLLSAPGRGTEVEAVFPLSNATESH